MTNEQIDKSLRADLETIGRIIANATLHIDFLNYVETQASDHERIVIKTYPIFSKIENTFWWAAILDLLKLCSKSNNDDYSLFTFIERIKSCYQLIKWEKPIDDSKLNSLVVQLESNSPLIDKIKKVRDKYIAHLDKERMRVDLTISDINELLSSCQQIHDELNFAFNYATTQWNFPWSQKGYQAFKNLSKYQKIREITSEYSINNKKLIDIQILQDIIKEPTSS